MDVDGQIALAWGDAEVRVHPLGATVLGYRDGSGEERLFVSPVARFQPGTAIRGGIPVCWPWFAGDGGPPSHGLARTRTWKVGPVRSDESGASIAFTLEDDAGTRALWPHRFRLTLTVWLADALTVALVHENVDDGEVVCTGALHAYLAVSDVAGCRVEGLDGAPFHDKVTGLHGTIAGDARFVGETDLIVDAGPVPVVLVDGDRRIRVTRTGSRTVVLWNPGPKAAGIVDLGVPDGFVCVEAANAGSDIVRIPPGGRHTLGITVAP